MAANPEPKPRTRRTAPRIAIVLAALAALAWHTRPDGRLHVIFPAVAGDAAIIRTPSGGFVLIDGGADPTAIAAALGRRMPFWQRSLDAVVLTSPDAQRLPGQVAALTRYRARVALAPPASSRGATFAEWQRLLAEQRTPVHTAQPGARLALGGATLTVLAAHDEGLLLLVQYGRTSAALAHTAGPALDHALPGRTGQCDLLAFPWERDPRSPLVEALQPRAILFTDGYRGDDPIELTYAERAVGGADLYHERVDGTIEWISDGQRAWVTAER
ncbi:MAG: hypothetical protein DIU80_004410 [Chloroflexota bacterium]|nr:MAG: hypothetical protein DIU80_17165 [Chloroflexota bacterium]